MTPSGHVETQKVGTFHSAPVSRVLHCEIAVSLFLQKARRLTTGRQHANFGIKGGGNMASFQRPRVFDPLDLEIIDRVYEAAWSRLEAQHPHRDKEDDGERQEELRKLVFAFAHTAKVGLGNHVDFDALSEQVLDQMAVTWAPPFGKKPRSTPPRVGA
jgi:hypothetical protein